MSRLASLSVLTGCFIGTCAVAAEGSNAWLTHVTLPEGFKIAVFTDMTPNARSMTLGDDGTVYVGTMTEGRVYAVRDDNRDGTAERVLTVASGLNSPNGVAFLKNDLYVAEIHRIVKLPNISANLAGPPAPQPVYGGYPSDRHHGWKYLRVGPDGKLYAPVGAPCNICKPEKDIYASLTRLDPDGSHFEIIAHGIRNTVGFDWQPGTQKLFFTENGRDWLGDDLPPEELNRLDQSGQHFGYPYCHAGRIADPEFGDQKSCTEYTAPVWTFPAHVAPLGLRFYLGKQFPERYRGQLFVAQHGSWNRTQAQGYRIAVVKFKDGSPIADEVFADGWLQADGTVLGRPVDILEMPDGALLISDDRRGAIYRVSYQQP